MSRLLPQIDEAKAALVKDAVPDQVLLKYFMGALWGVGVVCVIFPTLGFYSMNASNQLGRIETITNFLLVLAGVYWCYNSNGGHSGRRFLDRLIVLGAIVSIRVTAIFFPMWLVATSISSFMGIKDIPDAFCGTLLIAIILWRTNVHVKEVASTAGAV